MEAKDNVTMEGQQSMDSSLFGDSLMQQTESSGGRVNIGNQPDICLEGNCNLGHCNDYKKTSAAIKPGGVEDSANAGGDEVNVNSGRHVSIGVNV